MERIAIIGAGPAGCSAAYHLHKQGHEVFLIEKGEHVGGRTRTYRNEGFHLDTGAAFFTNFYPRVLKLLKVLGLRKRISPLKRINALAKEGQLAELNISSLPSFLKFPFVNRTHKSKMLRWVLKTSLKRKRVDLVRPVTLLKYDQQSVHEYAQQRLSDEIYQYFIRPGIEPFWYFSCEDISAAMVIALTSQAAGAKFYRLHNGIDQLCTALIRDVRVELSAEVNRVNIDTHGYQVHYHKSGVAHQLHVDRVVCATTAQYASHLVQDFPEHLVSVQQKEFLVSQTYVPHIHATFKVGADALFPRYSSIFPCGPGQHTWAAIAFHKEGNDHNEKLISVYLSAELSHELMQSQKSDAEIYQHCREVIAQYHLTLSHACLPFHVIKRTHAIPIHKVGRYSQAFEFQQQQKDRSILFCGDYLTTATIEGAVYSGMCVSEHIYDQTHSVSKKRRFFRRRQGV